MIVVVVVVVIMTVAVMIVVVIMIVAVAVMIMVVIMTVAVAMIVVVMVVTVAVVVRVIVAVAVLLGGGADIGAAFRVERRLDRHDAGAEPARHLLDHRVATDAQAPAGQLGRQVTIAQMPGDAGQRRRVGGANLGQRLRRGDHLDDAAVFQFQPIAGAQHHRFGQVEQEVEATHAGHGEAAAVAVVVIENDGIGRFLRPLTGGNDSMRVQHGASTGQ